MPSPTWIPSTCPTPSGTLTTTTSQRHHCVQGRMRTLWVVGEAYRFQVSYRPFIGYIQVRIFRPSVSNTIPYLDTGALYVQPSAATAGRIGLYTYSQSAVTFDSFDFSCCDGFTDASGNCLSYTACPSGQAEASPPTFNSNRVCVPDGKSVLHLLDVFVCALL